MSIDISVPLEDYCKECPYFDAETIKNTLYTDNKETLISMEVRCRNKKLCMRLAKQIEEKMRCGK